MSAKPIKSAAAIRLQSVFDWLECKILRQNSVKTLHFGFGIFKYQASARYQETPESAVFAQYVARESLYLNTQSIGCDFFLQDKIPGKTSAQNDCLNKA